MINSELWLSIAIGLKAGNGFYTRLRTLCGAVDRSDQGESSFAACLAAAAGPAADDAPLLLRPRAHGKCPHERQGGPSPCTSSEEDAWKLTLERLCR